MYGYDTRIRYSECDGEEFLRIESVIDYFQDIATSNSCDVGYSGKKLMAEKHQAWVLSSWQVEIDKYPQAQDYVRIITVPYEFKGFTGHRNCGMTDPDGNFLIKANSIWVLMDMEKGRPVKVPEEMQAAYNVGERLDMDYGFRRIELPKEGGEVLPAITVERHHLDSLGHVNNGQYVRLAVETAAAASASEAIIRPYGLRVEYKMQAHMGDALIPHVWKTADAAIVSFMNSEERVYATVELKKLNTAAEHIEEQVQ